MSHWNELEKLEQIKNAINNPHYNLREQTISHIQIKIDENIKTGLFIPDKQTPHLWYTNKQTYRAMKKDIFALETPEDLEEKYQCYSCSTILDLQYWLHCPYCESSIKK